MLFQLVHGVLFQLTDTLRRHLVLGRQLVQGGLFLGQPALEENIAAALVQLGQPFLQLMAGAVAPVRAFQLGGRIVTLVFQIVHRCVGGVVIIILGAIEAQILTIQAAFHLAHFPRGHAQVLRHGIDFVMGQPGQLLLGAAQVEEQLALRLGGRHLDDAPVAQDEFMNLGADPVHGEGHQAHAHFRVEALDRLHQADVAFLHQVSLGQAIAGVAAGDMHDKPQVGHDQLPGGLQILLVEQTIGQLALFFDAEDRDAAYGLNIGLQVGTWNQVMYGLQSSAHICVNSKNIRGNPKKTS